MKKYFYSLLYRYLSVHIMPDDTVMEVNPKSDILSRKFPHSSVFFTGNAVDRDVGYHADEGNPGNVKPDYILLNGILHFEPDIQAFLDDIHQYCSENTRIIITYYSFLWKPFMLLATRLGLRSKLPEANWVSPEDMSNFLLLSDFEPVRTECRVLIPFYIPVISFLVNRYLSPLPFFRIFNLIHILVARPVRRGNNHAPVAAPSVSVIVPARNEAGNIEHILRRLPRMGPGDELIFVEGHSTDATWEKICEVRDSTPDGMNIIAARQDGKGKGDAVRKGFELATKDILMILDADMTVPPEDLPRFYQALLDGKGEFINGSRLVYPMEKQAMRFLNLLGNKFFALAFSFVLGQRFKDTLCGTKAIYRDNYLKIARHRSFFGEFDPFGDFDLIFG
ncbi:glycosyltransferase family 2 protein, partial [bacterium]|nr:glycosyltransferase family 2 protein [bacterium]